MGLVSSINTAIFGKATDRILEAYGRNKGAVINSTGTGTKVIIGPSPERSTAFEDFFKEYGGSLIISEFSSGGSPIRPHPAACCGVKRALDGTLTTFGKMAGVEIDLTVIGNSEDYYKLTRLYNIYRKATNNRARGVGYNLNTDKIWMTIVANSAPGMNLVYNRGVMIEGDPGFALNGNASIGDKTFSFSFEDVTDPEVSKQKFDGGSGLIATLAKGANLVASAPSLLF